MTIIEAMKVIKNSSRLHDCDRGNIIARRNVWRNNRHVYDSGKHHEPQIYHGDNVTLDDERFSPRFEDYAADDWQIIEE